MPEQPDRPSVDGDAWAKLQAESDIAIFKNAVEDASIEEVGAPTGWKEVEIAWEDDDGFHVEDGEAVGVYRDLVDGEYIFRVDWCDERNRTTVHSDELVELSESGWYTDDRP